MYQYNIHTGGYTKHLKTKNGCVWKNEEGKIANKKKRKEKRREQGEN